MSNEYLNNLANELKKARKKSKLTIDQIFIKTRIDKKYLNAIEDGNFSVMPEVYIRAFVKEYSKSVGLDPAEIIIKYDAAREGKAYVDEDSESNQKKESLKDRTFVKESKSVFADSMNEGTDHSSKSNKSPYYFIGAISMLLTIILIYNVFLTEDDNRIITEKPFEQIIDEREQKAETEEQDIESKPVSKENFTTENVTKFQSNKEDEPRKTELVPQSIKEGELTLTIIAEEESWMRVVSDEQNNIEFIIQKGMTKVFNAKDKFYLHIGNSGGIKLFLNNKDILFSGSPGKVRKVFISESGIEYLRRTPLLNVEQE